MRCCSAAADTDKFEGAEDEFETIFSDNALKKNAQPEIEWASVMRRGNLSPPPILSKKGHQTEPVVEGSQSQPHSRNKKSPFLLMRCYIQYLQKH